MIFALIVSVLIIEKCYIITVTSLIIPVAFHMHLCVSLAESCKESLYFAFLVAYNLEESLLAKTLPPIIVDCKTEWAIGCQLFWAEFCCLSCVPRFLNTTWLIWMHIFFKTSVVGVFFCVSWTAWDIFIWQRNSISENFPRFIRKEWCLPPWTERLSCYKILHDN